MVFALGKFASLKWLRLLAALAESTGRWARGTCDLSVEAEASLPRLKTNILYDGRSAFVPSFPRRPFLGFEGAKVEAGCCSPATTMLLKRPLAVGLRTRSTPQLTGTISSGK